MRFLLAAFFAACGPASTIQTDAGPIDAGLLRKCDPENCGPVGGPYGCCDQATGKCLGYRPTVFDPPAEPFRDNACPRPTDEQVAARWACSSCAATDWCGPTEITSMTPPKFATWRCTPKRASKCLLTCPECCDEAIGVCGRLDGGVCLP